ncbi:MAG: DUF4012 domain-containing protein, partial [Chloroflexota bacterium]
MHVRIVAAAAVIIIVIAILVGGVTLVAARSDLTGGAAQLHLAVSQLRRSGLTKAGFDDLRRHVSASQDDFRRANSRLIPLGFLLPHLGWLPRFGSELGAAPALSRAAQDMTAGMDVLLAGLEPVVHDVGERKISPGRLLPHLAAHSGSFRRASALFAQASMARRTIVDPPSIRSQLSTFDRDLPKLETLSRGLQLLPALLGMHRPQTYLIAYQDSLELRSTGGFIGSYSLMTVRNGRVVNNGFRGTDFGNDENLSIPPPQPVALYNQEKAWLFRDANWSPNFPTTAALEQFFLRLDAHRAVDGVIDLTPQAAADLLEATGPLYIRPYHRWVNAGNVAY